MNIESYHDLQKLPANVIHYIQIIGLLEEIEFDGKSYLIGITQKAPGERLYYIKLLHKDHQRKYLYILLKWILFTIKQQSNDPLQPFSITNISQGNPIFLECQCKYVSKLNGDSGIFLSDMTPLDYDPSNDAMKNIMTRHRSISSIDSIGTVISQYSEGTVPNIMTTTAMTLADDTNPLFNLKRISDSQDDYNSQRFLPVINKRIKYQPISSIESQREEEEEEEDDDDDEFFKDMQNSKISHKYIKNIDQLRAFNELGTEFQYIGYIIGYVKVSPDWYRYNTILIGQKHDIASGEGFIEVYGQNSLKIGEYEFSCKTWQRKHDLEMIEYLIIRCNSISASTSNPSNLDEDETNNDNSVSKFNDQLIMFKELTLQHKNEQFVRIVGLCVSITNENPKFVSLCLTDFTINEKEGLKYLFDRYIDSWECYKLKLNEGYRVIMYPNFFKEFDKDIQGEYKGKSIFDLTSGMTGNISHQRIVVELTLRVTRYGDILNFVVRGHKILSCSGSSITRKPRSLNEDLMARTARILTICKEIKHEYFARDQGTVFKSNPINSDEYIMKTESFKVTKVIDILLTYGGKEFGCEQDKRIEILCQGELLDSKSKQNKKLTRIIINTPDLFFLGSENDVSNIDDGDWDDSKDIQRRSILTETITKLRNRPSVNEVTITDLAVALPHVLHLPVITREARDLVLQQLL
ncbi:telomere-binding protein CDC13 PWA37_001141 [Arxiozyma heterogenica]|uniref:telomere-binding protein CDC13 n=1 Tax=Arxiozyma heterogenica TaxID=278026 RepID=UPI002F064361